MIGADGKEIATMTKHCRHFKWDDIFCDSDSGNGNEEEKDTTQCLPSVGIDSSSETVSNFDLDGDYESSSFDLDSYCVDPNENTRK